MKTINNYARRPSFIFFLVLLLTTLSACSDENDDTDIPLSAVPANVISVVQKALPGIALSEAEKEIKDTTVIYELEGKLINGKEYDIKISADGTILKIELDD